MGRDFSCYDQWPTRDEVLVLKVNDLIKISRTKDQYVNAIKMLQFIMYNLTGHISILEMMVEMCVPESGDLLTLKDEYYEDTTIKWHPILQKNFEDKRIRVPGGSQRDDEMRIGRDKDMDKNDSDKKNRVETKKRADRKFNSGSKASGEAKIGNDKGRIRNWEGPQYGYGQRQNRDNSLIQIGLKSLDISPKKLSYTRGKIAQASQNLGGSGDFGNFKQMFVLYRRGNSLGVEYGSVRGDKSGNNKQYDADNAGGGARDDRYRGGGGGKDGRSGDDKSRSDRGGGGGGVGGNPGYGGSGGGGRRDRDDDRERRRKSCDTGKRRRGAKGDKDEEDEDGDGYVDVGYGGKTKEATCAFKKQTGRPIDDEYDENEVKKLREKTESFEAGGLWKCTGRVGGRQSYEDIEGTLTADSKGNLRFVPIYGKSKGIIVRDDMGGDDEDDKRFAKDWGRDDSYEKVGKGRYDGRGVRIDDGKGSRGRGYDRDDKGRSARGRDYDDEERGGRGRGYDRDNEGRDGRDRDYARDDEGRGGRGRSYDRDDKDRGGSGRDYDEDYGGRGGRDEDHDRDNMGRDGRGRDYDDRDDEGRDGRGKDSDRNRDRDGDSVSRGSGRDGRGERDRDDEGRGGRGKGSDGDWDRDRDSVSRESGRDGRGGRARDDEERVGRGKSSDRDGDMVSRESGRDGRGRSEDKRGGDGRGRRDRDDEGRGGRGKIGDRDRDRDGDSVSRGSGRDERGERARDDEERAGRGKNSVRDEDSVSRGSGRDGRGRSGDERGGEDWERDGSGRGSDEKGRGGVADDDKYRADRGKYERDGASKRDDEDDIDDGSGKFSESDYGDKQRGEGGRFQTDDGRGGKRRDDEYDDKSVRSDRGGKVHGDDRDKRGNGKGFSEDEYGKRRWGDDESVRGKKGKDRDAESLGSKETGRGGYSEDERGKQGDRDRDVGESGDDGDGRGGKRSGKRGEKRKGKSTGGDEEIRSDAEDLADSGKLKRKAKGGKGTKGSKGEKKGKAKDGDIEDTEQRGEGEDSEEGGSDEDIVTGKKDEMGRGKGKLGDEDDGIGSIDGKGRGQGKADDTDYEGGTGSKDGKGKGKGKAGKNYEDDDIDGKDKKIKGEAESGDSDEDHGADRRDGKGTGKGKAGDTDKDGDTGSKDKKGKESDMDEDDGTGGSDGKGKVKGKEGDTDGDGIGGKDRKGKGKGKEGDMDEDDGTGGTDRKGKVKGKIGDTDEDGGRGGKDGKGKSMKKDLGETDEDLTGEKDSKDKGKKSGMEDGNLDKGKTVKVKGEELDRDKKGGGKGGKEGGKGGDIEGGEKKGGKGGKEGEWASEDKRKGKGDKVAESISSKREKDAKGKDKDSLAGKGGEGDDDEDEGDRDERGGVGARDGKSGIAAGKGAAEKDAVAGGKAKGKESSLASMVTIQSAGGTTRGKGAAGRPGAGREGGIPRVGSIEVVTQSQFHQLERVVKELQKKAGPMAAPVMPENSRLLMDISKGAASLTDVIQALQLQARLQAAERAIDRMSELIAQLAAAGALTPEMLAKVADIHSAVRGYRDVPLGPGGQAEQAKELQKRLTAGKSSRAHIAGVTAPGAGVKTPAGATTPGAGARTPRPGAGTAAAPGRGLPRMVPSFGVVSTGQPSMRSEKTTDSVDCITQQDLDDALSALREEFERTVLSMTHKANATADTAAQTARGVEEKVDVVVQLDNRVTTLESMVDSYTEQLNGFDAGVTIQITSFQQQMDEMQKGLDDGLLQLQNVNNNAETAAMIELSERYDGLVADLDLTLHSHQAMTTHQNQLTDELKSLMEALEMLREQKADRDEVLDGLRDKADISRLEGLLTDKEFERVRNELEMRMRMCYEKFRALDHTWLGAMKDLSNEVSTKADMMQLVSVRDDMQEQLHQLNRKCIQLAQQMGDPKTAILARKLAKDGTCASCRIPALMEPTEVRATAPPAMPGLRRRPEPTGADWDVCLKDVVGGTGGGRLTTTTLPPVRDVEENQIKDVHHCKRWVGGSHTLVTPLVTREAAAARARPGVGVAVPVRRYVGPGTDGKLYLLAEACIPCEECNTLYTEKIPGEIIDQPGGDAKQGDITVVTGSEARRVTIISESELPPIVKEEKVERPSVTEKHSSGEPPAVGKRLSVMSKRWSEASQRQAATVEYKLKGSTQTIGGFEEPIPRKLSDIGIIVKGRMTVVDEEAARRAEVRYETSKLGGLSDQPEGPVDEATEESTKPEEQ